MIFFLKAEKKVKIERKEERKGRLGEWREDKEKREREEERGMWAREKEREGHVVVLSFLSQARHFQSLSFVEKCSFPSVERKSATRPNTSMCLVTNT